VTDFDDQPEVTECVVGVDWASKGWLCVACARTSDGAFVWQASMEPAFNTVLQSYSDASHVLVDIPIGLPETDRRVCDREAKACLDERSSSVFWTPCRRAVYAGSYEAAATANEQSLGRGLSSQSWGLIPRIREVDMLLRWEADARNRVRESHPEVAFRMLNGDDAVTWSKQTETGRDERIDILDDALSNTDVRSAYDEIEATYIDDPDPWQRRIGTSNRDDLVDAFGLAVTALLGMAGSFERLPGEDDEVPTDEVGLPMEIVYTNP
jgi:predicted RNase H-like nuclease